MERYSHLQSIPNSPLSPLTPLSENTKFEFNFGGDGSLDAYINNVRQEHRVKQQQQKLLQQVNKAYHKTSNAAQPRRFSNEFIKIRDVFEGYQNKKLANNIASKVPKIEIIHAENMLTPIKSKKQLLTNDHDTTPTNIRAPLRPLNQNIPQNMRLKDLNLQQQKLKEKCLNIMQESRNRHNLKQKRSIVFRQASPVATKPLCPRIAKILEHRGLTMYSAIFQREEIDLYAFHLLTLLDLHQMGITNHNHCTILMNHIYDAGRYFEVYRKEM